MRRKLSPARRGRRSVAEDYEYRDEHGHIIYLKRRFAPKDFQYLRPNGTDWIAKRRRPLLYRLPDLIASDQSKVVFICEGEKDVDRLWEVGLVATCNDDGGGRGKWRRSHSRYLRGRSVAILPDNDKTGREHADDVAKHLQKIVSELRIVLLPDLPRKGDVTDWLNAGGTAEKLLRLQAASPLWEHAVPQIEFADFEYRFIEDSQHITSILKERRLSVIEKLLLIILAKCNEKRQPSQETLAWYLDVSERRIRQIIAGLKGKHKITTSRFRGRNHYRVNWYERG